MKNFLLLVALILALGLAGCASLSENECRTADWESIGYIDGTRGYNSGRIGEHSEACAKVSIVPDSKLYEEGRNRGLEEFCTSRNGVRLGEQGGSYGGVCPVVTEDAFLRGYEAGKNLREIKDYMARVQSDVQNIEARLRSKQQPPSDYERDQLIYRLRDLERSYGRAQSDLRRAERRAQEL